MSIAGLPDPYCDVAYADGINSSAEWTGAATSVKEAALQWTRVYIDSKYVCSFDADDPPDNVKTANAMLAEQYVIDATKFFSVESSTTGIKRERVKAGAVESETEYVEGASISATDQFPHVTALLGDVCVVPAGDVGFAAILRR